MRRALPLILLLLVLGCRTSLNDEFNLEVTAASPQVREISPIANSQTVKVTAKASSGKFDIYFFLKKDQDAVEKELDKAGAKLLAKKTNVLAGEEATLSATVPANEAAIVLLNSSDGKKAEVKVRITN